MKASASAGRTPAFCGSSPVLTWISTRGRAPAFMPASASARASFSPVQGLDDVEQGHGLVRLVGLQRSDQPQLQIGQGRAPFAPAALRLLHPVFAEHALAGVQGGLDRGFGLLLGNGGQRDIRRVPPRRARCPGDAAAHRVQG